MTTLHDRLTDLAADAPSSPADPGLWDRAARWHRRRRTGTLMIAGLCCLLVAAIGVADWQASRTSTPVATGEQELAVPDRIEEPSAWLPGTDGEPFDPLIAIIAADRGSWTGSDPGWVGVSAATGEYRFLDLPDDAGAGTSLSPDGRYVGYWLTGQTPGPPGHANDTPPVVGFAVYDVDAGEPVVATDAGATHGLMPMALEWIDDRHLAASYSKLRARDARSGTTGEPHETDLVEIPSGTTGPWPRGQEVDSGGGGWALEWGRPSVVRSLDGRTVRIHRESGIPPVVDPSGERAAGLLAFSGRGGVRHLTPAPIGIAKLGPQESSRLEAIPGGKRYYDIIGWRDEYTVLVLGASPREPESRSVYAVDIRSGEEERLLGIDVETQFAPALLHLPVTTQPSPPRPWDPRIVLGLVVAVVLASGAAVVGWRRRVRP